MRREFYFDHEFIANKILRPLPRFKAVLRKHNKTITIGYRDADSAALRHGGAPPFRTISLNAQSKKSLLISLCASLPGKCEEIMEICFFTLSVLRLKCSGRRVKNQIGAWATVHVGKWSSWPLLVIMTFTIVANLKHIKHRIHIPA